jgi:hypothetical protein
MTEYEQMARQKFQMEMRQKAHDYDDVAFFLSTRPLGVGEALGMNAAVRHLRQEAQKFRAEAKGQEE